jgi:hypothetical protein
MCIAPDWDQQRSFVNTIHLRVAPLKRRSVSAMTTRRKVPEDSHILSRHREIP